MYILFAWSTYEAWGGAYDLRGTYSSLDEAKGAHAWFLDEHGWDCAHIATIQDGRLVVVAEYEDFDWRAPRQLFPVNWRVVTS